MTTIPKEALIFLEKLKKNNNREWFGANKNDFKRIESVMKLFYYEVEKLMKKHDDISETKSYRIYRDIRFSKDKSPFKQHFAAHFERRKPALRGGYYLHIEPGGNSMIGGGFWAPTTDDIRRVRQEWANDASEFKTIVGNKNFKAIWGEMEGEKLKSAPSGFSREHPNIDLINYKQWLFHHSFSDQEVLADDFATKIDECFQTIRTFFDYMSEVLTTDLNGVSLI